MAGENQGSGGSVNTDQWAAGVPRLGAGASGAGSSGAGSGGAGSGGATTFADPSDPLVYMGKKSSGSQEVVWTGPDGQQHLGAVRRPTVWTGPDGQQHAGAGTLSDNTRTRSQVVQEFYGWSEARRRQWAQHLLSLGLITEAQSRDFYTLQKWWEQLVTDAAGVYSNGAGQRLDPWATARLVAGDADAIAARKAEGRAAMPFTGTKSQTSTSVDLTDPTTAKALINDVLAQALGRAATPDELTAFTAVLNEAERKNPTQNVTSTTYQNGDAVSSSSTSSGGLTGAARQQILLEQAQESPDFGAYQASTVYYNALLSAIRSPV